MANKALGLLILLATMVTTTMLLAPLAQAHVLVANENNTTGAVLHITPDDDPIAGESSHIFFDIQDKKFSDGTYTPTLAIINDKGSEQIITTEKDGSYVSARYTFPSRGVYTIRLTIEHQGSAEVFSVTQRVSRGVGATNDSGERLQYKWAEALTVASLAGISVLLIIFAARLRTVLKHSQ